MADTLFDGRAFRILTVVDSHTRESLTIVPRSRFRPPPRRGRAGRAGARRPGTIRCDSGPEFAGRLLDQWSTSTAWDWTSPGPPRRRTRPSSSPSRSARGKSASTPSGSLPCPPPGLGSAPGVRSTAKTAPLPPGALGPRGVRPPCSDSRGGRVAPGSTIGASPPAGSLHRIWTGMSPIVIVPFGPSMDALAEGRSQARPGVEPLQSAAPVPISGRFSRRPIRKCGGGPSGIREPCTFGLKGRKSEFCASFAEVATSPLDRHQHNRRSNRAKRWHYGSTLNEHRP